MTSFKKKKLSITFITMLNTAFPESHNKMKDKPVQLRKCLLSEMKCGVKCATLECKVHIRGALLLSAKR